jgi:hypothetical protein
MVSLGPGGLGPEGLRSLSGPMLPPLRKEAILHEPELPHGVSFAKRSYFARACAAPWCCLCEKKLFRKSLSGPMVLPLLKEAISHEPERPHGAARQKGPV